MGWLLPVHWKYEKGNRCHIHWQQNNYTHKKPRYDFGSMPICCTPIHVGSSRRRNKRRQGLPVDKGVKSRSFHFSKHYHGAVEFCDLDEVSALFKKFCAFEAILCKIYCSWGDQSREFAGVHGWGKKCMFCLLRSHFKGSLREGNQWDC